MSGRNFISKDFEVVCIEHGTENTPQDIGLAECTNGIVVTMTKYMLKAQKLKSSKNRVGHKWWKMQFIYYINVQRRFGALLHSKKR